MFWEKTFALIAFTLLPGFKYIWSWRVEAAFSEGLQAGLGQVCNLEGNMVL